LRLACLALALPQASRKGWPYYTRRRHQRHDRLV